MYATKPVFSLFTAGSESRDVSKRQKEKGEWEGEKRERDTNTKATAATCFT